MLDKKRTEMRNNESVKKMIQEISSKEESSSFKNNKAIILGIIEEELQYSHSVKWENFYKTYIRVERLSDKVDVLPVIISEIWLKDILDEKIKGKSVIVIGQLRSHNEIGEDNKSHLELFLFATKFKFYDENNGVNEIYNTNMIFLDGYLCKEPVLRETPRGKLLAYCLIAINRQYRKSDYIPCIAWEKDAKWLNEFKAGERFQLYGRIQSRLYLKKINNEQNEEVQVSKVAYEVSIKTIQNVKEDKIEMV